MMMQKRSRRCFLLAAALWMVFAVFTGLVSVWDVRAIGPQGSAVGLARINEAVFRAFGVQMAWYYVTDWLGMVSILFAVGFAITGGYQLVKRKSIRMVDRSLLLLGCIYSLMAIMYLLFECMIVNYRPVMFGNTLEASYPSTHVMLTVCIMITAAIQIRRLCPARKTVHRMMDLIAAGISVLTVVGRCVSGVHWFTDIVGGLLLAAALTALYYAILKTMEEHSA